MKQILIVIMILASNAMGTQAQQISLKKLKFYEHQLDDVMEIIDTITLVDKLKEVEQNYKQDATEINKVRLSIIYHETALNLTFLAKSTYKGYAQKSFDLLTQLETNFSTTPSLLPFIASYRASALALVGGETKKLSLVGQSFKLFEEAIEKYAEISYIPEFLRGSVAENLPWFFFRKRKFAKQDMQAIINKHDINSEYATDKIMSFTYWAWANQHQQKKYRKEAIAYLYKASALDPFYQAGRKRGEELKLLLTK